MRGLRTTDPRRIGPYRLLAELGQGGMGRVLLGSGPDGRLVAVKVVHEQFAHDEEFRARFRREVEACRAVSGAYTAAVVGADPDAEVPWLASVFVAGPSLAETIATVGALPEAAVLRLAAGLTTSLAHIHGAGLVHRDFKPANVLITDDGPRVIDFGIVRDSVGDELTRTGWLVGSPAFMSPEQADGGPVTPASDVFSLGAVVVAAATGASPFTGTSTLRTLSNVVGLDPDLDGVPAAVRRIVRPCLAKQPGERPTPAELLDAIGQIAPSGRPWPEPVHELIARRQAEVADVLEPGRDATVVVSGRPAGSTRVEPRAVERARRWLPPVALVVAVVAAVLVGWALWPSGTTPSTGEPGPKTTPATSTSTPAPVPGFERLGEIAGTSPAEGLGFSPDGSVLSVRFEDDTMQSWTVADGQQVGQIIGSFTGGGLGPPVFDADGRTVSVVRTEEGDAVVEQWDVLSGQRRGTPFVARVGEDVRVDPMLGPGGRTMAATLGPYSEDATVHAWDLAGRRAIAAPATGYVEGFSRDGRVLLVSESIEHLHHLTRWDVAAGRRLGDPVILPEHEFLRAFTFEAGNRVLVTLSETGHLRWWDTTSGNQTRQPVTIATDADSGDIDLVAFSPDGTYLVTLTETGAVTVIDVATGEPAGAPIQDVTVLAFAPDGTLATAGTDDRISLWRLPAR